MAWFALMEPSTGFCATLTELGGNETRYEYDNMRRLTRAETRGPAGNTLRNFTYAYDRHSSLIKEQSNPPASTATPGLDSGTLWLQHNSADELCAVLRSGSDPGLVCGTGNPSGTTNYDGTNRDAAGNLRSASGVGTSTQPLNGITLAYNQAEQTTSITPPGGAAQTQAYDGVTQDRRTQSGSTTMSYGFSGQTSQATPATGSTPAHSELFVRDPSGNLLAMLDNTGGSINASATRYYLVDEQKSVIATIPASEPAQNPSVTRYLYEPYGQLIRSWIDSTPSNGDSDSENPNAPAPSADYNPWRYISGYTDPTTGLLKLGTRYYAPQLGTWTQSDPKSGKMSEPATLNMHLYAAGDPINKSDPSGRYWGEDFIEGAADLVWEGLEYAGSCLAGVGLAEAGLGTTAFAVGGVIAGGPIGGTIGLGAVAVFGCAAGVAAEYYDVGAALDVPTFY